MVRSGERLAEYLATALRPARVITKRRDAPTEDLGHVDAVITRQNGDLVLSERDFTPLSVIESVDVDARCRGSCFPIESGLRPQRTRRSPTSVNTLIVLTLLPGDDAARRTRDNAPTRRAGGACSAARAAAWVQRSAQEHTSSLDSRGSTMLKVTFTGNLLADPEINYAQNDRGTEYVKIRVALNKKKGDNKLFAVADVAIFKFTQEANERFRTGSRVLVTGDAFPDFYEQKDGTIVAKLDVVADAWEDLERREDRSDGAQGNGGTRRPPQQPNGAARPATGNGRSDGGTYGRSGNGGAARRPTRSY